MTSPDFLGFTHHRVNNGSVSIHYQKSGQGDPVILLHGWPQHSLMWHTIAPILAQNYTVYIPDLRGAGGSSITASGYDKKTMAQDIIALLDREALSGVHLVGYDLGSGVAYSLAAQAKEKVRSLTVMEFGLPGYGYEEIMKPTPKWNSGSNWHLAFFTVPEVAEFAFRGKERELLSWFFWHISGQPEAVSHSHFEQYVRQITKPGALRAGIEYYAAVWQDLEDNREFGQTLLDIPVLAIGGEFSSGAFVEQLFKPVASNVQGVVIPQVGHWLGDENPEFLAKSLQEFFHSVV
jgi:pimeloyl-ACP methyl ester carboxylesterase